MRQFKFRVWDTFNNRMVEQPYRFEPAYNPIENGAPFIFYEDWRDVDDGISRPCHVMQFTGLFYKDGSEVYEGDIFKNRRGFSYEVRWINACFHAVHLHKNYLGPRHAAFTQRVSNSCVRIGHIYEPNT